MKAIIIILILLSAGMVWAQEIDYPDIPPVSGITSETSLEAYAEYAYYFLVFGSGILALIVLLYASFGYITSLGNPAKMSDARDRILSALLGLAIVFGSWVILARINPQFLTFDMPELEPLIDRLAPGVLVCKDSSAPVQRSWDLQRDYLGQRIPVEEKAETRNIIRNLNREISENCYYVTGKENIKESYKNKVQIIWLIPDHVYDIEAERMVIKEEYHYGVAVFEERNQKGRGHVYFEHFFLPRIIGLFSFSVEDFQIASVAPFKRYTPNWVRRGDIPDPVLWEVELFEDVNFNASSNSEPFTIIESTLNPRLYWLAHNSSLTGNIIPWPITNDQDILNPFLAVEGDPTTPKSMIINGEAMVILYKDSLTELPDGTFHSNDLNHFEIFFAGEDNNLELDNDNIIRWVSCAKYKSDDARMCDSRKSPLRPYTSSDPIGSGALYAMPCCAQAAVDGIIVIGNVR